MIIISLQENNKSQSKSRFTSPKAVSRKSKTRLSKSKQEMNEINKGEIILDSKPALQESQPQVQIAQMQHQSLGEPKHNLSLVRKPVFGVSEQADTNRAIQPQKMARGLKFRLLVEEGLFYPCNENKGADQLCGYRTADLRLCFRICKKLVFSRRSLFKTKELVLSDRTSEINMCRDIFGLNSSS